MARQAAYNLWGVVTIGVSFIISSILLGIGLSMDAFSVSLANGLNEPDMQRSRRIIIAGTFAAFQAAMPLIGWVCVHTAVKAFAGFGALIPWTALILLTFIGGKMIYDGVRGEQGDMAVSGTAALLVQAVATSIDALSVGFTIADESLSAAITSALIIALVTFVLCTAGVAIGRRAGMLLAGKAQILGGLILIAIGINIFIS